MSAKKPQRQLEKTIEKFRLPAARKDIGRLNKRQLLELNYCMQVQLLAEIGAIKQQIEACRREMQP